jgi:hypothetical protein
LAMVAKAGAEGADVNAREMSGFGLGLRLAAVVTLSDVCVVWLVWLVFGGVRRGVPGMGGGSR